MTSAWTRGAARSSAGCLLAAARPRDDPQPPHLRPPRGRAGGDLRGDRPRQDGAEMSDGLEIAFFGSSLVSSWWNGACTYYRGLLRALAGLGHEITFFEPLAYSRQEHRDIPDPDYATVVFYRAENADDVRATVETAAGADVVVKASGVGVFDDVLEEEVARVGEPGTVRVFWDVDAPATLARLAGDPADPFRTLLPSFDLVLTYGGGRSVVDRYEALGARECAVIYNALDPATHHRVAPGRPLQPSTARSSPTACPIGRSGSRSSSSSRPRCSPSTASFSPATAGRTRSMPANTRCIGHLGTAEHNAFNSSPTFVLNVTRDSMASHGWSPATRVFEAAGAGACLITDAWEGIEEFLAARRGDPRRPATGRRWPPTWPRWLRAGQGRSASGPAPGSCSEPHLLRAAPPRWIACSAPTPERPGDRRPAHGRSSGSPSPRRGGTATPRTTAASCGRFRRRGHDVLFLERDVPWYAAGGTSPVPLTAGPSSTARSSSCRSQFGRRYRRCRPRRRRLLCSGGAQRGAARDGGRRRRHGVLRHRHAGHARRRRPGRLRVPHGRTDPGVRPVPVVHGRPDARAGSPSEFGAREVRAFHCFVDPETYRPADVPRRWDLGYLGTYSDGPPARPRSAPPRAGTPPARAALRRGRPAVPGLDRLAAPTSTRLEHVAPPGPSGVLLGPALHAQPHAGRHARRRLVAERPAVRGRRLRRPGRCRTAGPAWSSSSGPERRSSPPHAPKRSSRCSDNVPEEAGAGSRPEGAGAGARRAHRRAQGTRSREAGPRARSRRGRQP